jgi:hypothetical protein
VRVSKEFDVRAPLARVAAVLEQDATLTDLFPGAETEIVGRQGETRTTRSRYRLLGRQGEAVFHFTTGADGMRFEKECDGRLWKQLSGRVVLRARGEATRIAIEIEGRTKGLVPEFTIRKPLDDQLDEMVAALRRRLEGVRA